jgi:hypothetical protein
LNRDGVALETAIPAVCGEKPGYHGREAGFLAAVRNSCNEERLKQVQSMARAMDDQFSVPGTKIRFGWDSILGVAPGLGDALTSAISLLIVHHAWQSGASPLLLARMLANIGVDFLLGSIPLWVTNRIVVRATSLRAGTLVKTIQAKEDSVTGILARGIQDKPPWARKSRTGQDRSRSTRSRWPAAS